MTIDYTWSFPQFDCIPSKDGLTNIVKTIHWRLDGTNGQFSCGAYGTVALADPDADSFVAYENITPQWAIDAVMSCEGFDLDEIKSAIANNIAAQANPPSIPMKPPFAE